MTANEKKPLSFRAWGAFTYSALPMAESAFEDEGLAAEEVAHRILAWAESRIEMATAGFADQEFSEAIGEHPNQKERGAYAISYVVSLINEGRLDEARRIASAYAKGERKSVNSHTHDGVDFHSIALRWIDVTANTA